MELPDTFNHHASAYIKFSSGMRRGKNDAADVRMIAKYAWRHLNNFIFAPELINVRENGYEL
jgi:hypothetical protein